MLLSEFISLFTFVCKMFWSFLIVIYNIPLTKNIRFGDTLVVIIMIIFVVIIAFKPLKKG
ncbi:MAG: hypothetical protein HFI87_02105 [Bacilli bacterium]|nr:hypothetical protein [Bacilli bacterium]